MSIPEEKSREAVIHTTLYWPTSLSAATVEATRKLNGLPYKPTGEKIGNSGLWCVYEFVAQLDAMLFGMLLRDAGWAANNSCGSPLGHRTARRGQLPLVLPSRTEPLAFNERFRGLDSSSQATR